MANLKISTAEYKDFMSFELIEIVQDVILDNDPVKVKERGWVMDILNKYSIQGTKHAIE